MKVTVDLNVLLDVAQNRLPHYRASEEVLHRARLGEFAAVLPGHALTTIHYIIEKHAGTGVANATVDGLLGDFEIHPVDKPDFQRARQRGASVHCQSGSGSHLHAHHQPQRHAHGHQTRLCPAAEWRGWHSLLRIGPYVVG